VDEVPAMIEAGLAAIVTAGVTTGSVGGVLDLAAPQPASIRKSGNNNIATKGEESLQRDLYGRIFTVMCLLTREFGDERIGTQSRKIDQKAPLSIGGVGNVPALLRRQLAHFS
jgi:hypothetical protein